MPDQSPVTTGESPVKMQKTSDFKVDTEKKRLQPGPCENKDKYWKGIKCSHAMMMLLT